VCCRDISTYRGDAGPAVTRQGSRSARPAPPADVLDRRRLARRFDRHALMAQRERYAAPRFKACVAVDKFAPFSGKSLGTAEAPWLILPDFAGWSGYPSIAALSTNRGIDVMGQYRPSLQLSS
jgi:hypothetical protein